MYFSRNSSIWSSASSKLDLLAPRLLLLFRSILLRFYIGIIRLVFNRLYILTDFRFYVVIFILFILWVLDFYSLARCVLYIYTRTRKARSILVGVFYIIVFFYYLFIYSANKNLNVKLKMNKKFKKMNSYILCFD